MCGLGVSLVDSVLDLVQYSRLSETLSCTLVVKIKEVSPRSTFCIGYTESSLIAHPGKFKSNPW